MEAIQNAVISIGEAIKTTDEESKARLTKKKEEKKNKDQTKGLGLNTYNFSLVVVRHPDGRFLLVQETPRHHRLWWLPGGRVEHGDSFITTACKETMEEGGLKIKCTGLLRVESSSYRNPARQRMIFLAEPDESPIPEIPKDKPDSESDCSRWVTLKDLETTYAKVMRGKEPNDWFGYLQSGGPVFSLDLLENEPEKQWTDEEIIKKKKTVETRAPHPTNTYFQVLLYDPKTHKCGLVKSNETLDIFKGEVNQVSVELNTFICSEAKKELGSDIKLIALLKIIRDATIASADITYVYLAELNNSESKDVVWTSLKESESLSPQAKRWVEHVEKKGQIYPLSILDHEGAKPKNLEHQKILFDYVANYFNE